MQLAFVSNCLADGFVGLSDIIVFENNVGLQYRRQTVKGLLGALGQKGGLRRSTMGVIFSRTSEIQKIEVRRRLKNGIDNPLMQNR